MFLSAGPWTPYGCRATPYDGTESPDRSPAVAPGPVPLHRPRACGAPLDLAALHSTRCPRRAYLRGPSSFPCRGTHAVTQTNAVGGSAVADVRTAAARMGSHPSGTSMARQRTVPVGVQGGGGCRWAEFLPIEPSDYFHEFALRRAATPGRAAIRARGRDACGATPTGRLVPRDGFRETGSVPPAGRSPPRPWPGERRRSGGCRGRS